MEAWGWKKRRKGKREKKPPGRETEEVRKGEKRTEKEKSLAGKKLDGQKEGGRRRKKLFLPVMSHLILIWLPEDGTTPALSSAGRSSSFLECPTGLPHCPDL